ncbi:SpoIIE family protein phosphatase [Streptomyces sp. CBMA152]|uniref:SpoIIE family protein phosphatase n=1 Tax=Streptomyces sp. CBMA152 TaxID=1896312 RepID=UPI0016614E79|nr:SpoIIE family protein phosphatase [Streptomyces sp. CBMA152]MBD0741014.1 diguanylate cyclase [Streptomyces sp. CBMA152]
MTGSAESRHRAPGRLTALLTGAVAESMRAVGGHVGGAYLRSSTPGLLRLAVLAGLPGPLFRPWWRMHMDRPFPVADAHRLGVEIQLADSTETMRRYPQLAAGLPFRFGSVYVPVVGASTPYGVLAVLRPATPDATAVKLDRDRLTEVAQGLGAALLELEEDGPQVVWDGEPLSVRPPADDAPPGAVGRFSWDLATGTVTADDTLSALLGTGDFTGTPEALAASVAPHDAHQLLAALRETAETGQAPPRPLRVRAADGGMRLLEVCGPGGAAPDDTRLSGIVVDMGGGATGDGAAELLPEGVFTLDRLGLISYVNPRAALLLGRPRAELLGQPLWQAVPWLDRPAYEDHLRGALLSRDPVHFRVRRPRPDNGLPEERPGYDKWLSLSAYPGPDGLTFTAVPLGHDPDTVGASTADPASGAGPVDAAADQAAVGPLPPTALASLADSAGTAPPPEAVANATATLYPPLFLAIALSEAVTARQVSAVVMRELLPAFGGRRLAIYLLHERRLYLAWETGFPQGFLDPFDGVGLDVRLPGVETLTTGRPLFFESMQQLAAAYPGIALDAEQGARAFLPLIASGRPVGSCILGFDIPRTFSAQERTVLTALAGLIAQALERAQRYDTEAALARGLQAALLPHRLPAHPQVETAGRYLPGTQGMDVGGDWYDVIEAGEGLALVIGDVQGHGVQAAATMGQLRSAVRAFALGGHSPQEVMSGTNRLLIDLDPGQFASCCYIRLDPGTGLAQAARAGHPQPLLRHPDGATEVLDLPGGVVLGVDPTAAYPVTQLRLEPGAVLALYTDGLVENPGTDIDTGIERLRAALAQAAAPTRRGGASLTGTADLLIEQARQTTDRPDDIALLLTTRRATPSAP